jgi:dihydrolipoamide dehydrogenase
MDFDLIVIGGGPAGYVAAIRAAQLGLKTACIDKRAGFGGVCLNVGCIPSKALLESSEHFFFAKKKLAEHGVITSSVQLDLEKMMQRKEDIVKKLVGGVEGLFRKNKITGFIGSAFCKDLISAKKVIEVHTPEKVLSLTTSRVLIATGSEAASLPGIPFNGSTIVSSTEALSFTSLPQSLLVIGAGAIGLEMGSVWSRLGSDVTIIEYAEAICPTADRTASKELEKQLLSQGIKFHLSSQVTKVESNASGVSVSFTQIKTQQMTTLRGDKVLIAVGRKPNNFGFGLQEANMKIDAKGKIEVNENYETNVSGVFAIGDVITGPMLAHKASEEGVVAVERMLGQKSHLNLNHVPNVIYTWPELASVGSTEEELKAQNRAYKAGSFPFKANGRAITMGESGGFVKVLADQKTDQILGVHIVGPRASDLITEAVTIMEFGGSAEDIARITHAHPSLSESVKEAALAVDKKTINL